MVYRDLNDTTAVVEVSEVGSCSLIVFQKKSVGRKGNVGKLEINFTVFLSGFRHLAIGGPFQCKAGGLVIQRHNEIRDCISNIAAQLCHRLSENQLSERQKHD